MPYGMYISAEGAMAQGKLLETISNNLANADTTAFKRDLDRVQARHAEAIERGSDYSGSQTINNIGGGVRVRETVTDFSQGVLKPTGNRLDMAIQGEGFFTVSKNGQTFLTRAGNFTLDDRGQLTTTEGYPVLNRSGSPIVIGPGEFDVSSDGAIVQQGEKKYLNVVRPQSTSDLVKMGQNLFRSLGSTLPVDDGRTTIRSGYLEASSVRPTTEMLNMIKASRAFEANIKMIQNQDHMLGTLISRALGA